ncbi:TolC family protein [Dasania marina]|uniref:TolC family protein n=1 Tax=Dasania marina TaxID=471499 RepID=UPI000373E4D6|nr:TolC family protein [Dasania marina]
MFRLFAAFVGLSPCGIKAIFTGLLLALLASGSVQAGSSSLSLTMAIQQALAANPDLQSFQFKAQVLNSQLASARLRPAYALGIELENVAGSGEFNGFDQADITVSLSSTLELGGKRDARIAVAQRSRSHFDTQRELQSLSLLGEVTRRYIAVLSAQQQLALANSAERLAKETVNEVRKRTQAGASPKAELRRAEAAAAQAHLSVYAQQQQLRYLKIALAALWGANEAGFDTVTGDLYSFGEDASFEALFSRLASNPAIQVYTAEQRLKEAELTLAKTAASADINWSLGIKHMQASDDTAVVAGFTVPLFAGSRSSAALSSATAASQAVAARKTAALLKLRTQLFAAFNQRQQAIHIAGDLRKDIVPALQAALQETQQAYQRGRYGYIDYVSAQQELLTAQRRLIAAASTALRYGADIEQLTAQPLTASHYLSATTSAGPELTEKQP